MKNAIIFCQKWNQSMLSFYLRAGGQEYYLFGQGYQCTVYRHYKSGVLLDDALDFTKCRSHPILLKIAEKLPSYLRYIEKEYEITVLRRSAGKETSRRSRWIMHRDAERYRWDDPAEEISA